MRVVATLHGIDAPVIKSVSMSHHKKAKDDRTVPLFCLRLCKVVITLRGDV